MFTFLFLLFSLVSSASALSPLNKPVIRTATAPLENVKLFEQSNLLKDVQPAFLREAEIKHGRLAMVSSILLPVSEQF